MGILKKALSASGPIVRVLVGAGAIAVLMIGLVKRPRKTKDNCPKDCREDERAPRG